MMNALLVAAALAMATSGQVDDHDHSPQLGRISFESSCRPEAHVLLLRGLGWLHSFEYEEAAQSFADAAAANPDCAIAWWGVAMSFYHPLWAPPSPDDLEKGRVALNKAQSASLASKRERDYIAALDIFYRNSQQLNYKDRAVAYSSEMEKLHKRYPQDSEAAVLYALTLIAAGTMDNDPAFSKEKAAAAILNRILAENADHPGVAHYLIHSFDYPNLADLALPAARRYASIAPTSAHAQHMPSHIFTRLGLWDEAIQSDSAAKAAAVAYARAKSMPGSWDEQLHAMDYLAYAFLQTGQDDEAQRILAELNHIQRVDPPNFKVAYAATAIPARFLLERRRWREAALLELPVNVSNLAPLANFKWAEAHVHFARAIGAARDGSPALARVEIIKLGEIEEALVVRTGEYDWRVPVSVLRQMAQSWLSFLEGRNDEAVRLMRAAADLDDMTEKHPVTPGAILPAREQLGELLLALSRPADALEEFERSLRRAPRRLAGLYGAARAAKLAGNQTMAEVYYVQLSELTKKGDASRVEIKEARDFVAGLTAN
jgi:tetratricopeptide (TPR) repeat protein